MDSFGWIFWFMLWSRTVLAIGRFTNPATSETGLEYNLGDVITISWTDISDYDTLSLGVMSSANNIPSWLIENSDQHPTSYVWTVNVDQIGFNLSSSQLFQFYIVNGTNSSSSFSSALFLVPESPTNSVATVTEVVTQTASATSSATPCATGSNGTTCSSPGYNTASDRYSVGDRVGFFVGLGVGIFLLLGLASFFYRRWLKKHGLDNRSGATEPADPTSMTQTSSDEGAQQQHEHGTREYYAVKPPQTDVRENKPVEYYAVPEREAGGSEQISPAGRENAGQVAASAAPGNSRR